MIANFLVLKEKYYLQYQSEKRTKMLSFKHNDKMYVYLKSILWMDEMHHLRPSLLIP